MTITPARSAPALLVEPYLRALLDRLDPHTRLVAGYHLGYWDAHGGPSDAGGKAVRARLALLSARAAGHGAEDGVPAAAAVELAHNFSLLHDDVMDGDALRRHRPTAWTVFGTAAAILTGDALLALASEALCDGARPGALAATCRLASDVRRLVAGQQADLDFEHRDDVRVEECVAMATDKTAALMSCAAALGALLCGAPAATVDALSRYGAEVGIAFQFADDLLGIWGDPARTGKPVHSDLRSRKKSLPVVWAATAPSQEGARFRELYASPASLGEADLARAARLIELAGGRDWASQQAVRHTDTAIRVVRRAGLPAEVCDELVAVAHALTGRDR